jgi:hypothetical protein
VLAGVLAHLLTTLVVTAHTLTFVIALGSTPVVIAVTAVVTMIIGITAHAIAYVFALVITSVVVVAYLVAGVFTHVSTNVAMPSLATVIVLMVHPHVLALLDLAPITAAVAIRDVAGAQGIPMMQMSGHRRRPDRDRMGVVGIAGRSVAQRDTTRVVVHFPCYAGLPFRAHAVAHRCVCLFAWQRYRTGTIAVQMAAAVHRSVKSDKRIGRFDLAVCIDVTNLELTTLIADRGLQHVESIGSQWIFTVTDRLPAVAVIRSGRVTDQNDERCSEKCGKKALHCPYPLGP